MQSDRTHSRAGILSPYATRASGGAIFFVSQGLSFSKLSTFSLSSFELFFDDVRINISMNNSSSLSLLKVYAPPICFSLMDSRTDFFFLSILPSSRNLFILGDFNCHYLLWDSKRNSDHRGGEIFNWVISFDFLLLNDPDTPTLPHRSFGSRFSIDISFVPSSLALSCS